MAEQNVKGGNVREVSLVSTETARPANKGGNLLARQDPLIDTHGATPKRVSLLGGAVLSIGIAAFAFGCDDGKNSAELPDAGWDGGSECEDGCPDGGANDAVLELCGEPGSAVTDNEELIAVGGKKAVFTKAGRNIVAVVVDEENEFVTVRLAEDKGEPLDNGHFGYDEMDSEDPTISVYEDESKAVTLGFCGIENSEEGIAARIATDRRYQQRFGLCAS
jgi:hypothetical protein